jgi:hypothetical protein
MRALREHSLYGPKSVGRTAPDCLCYAESRPIFAVARAASLK